MTPARGGGGGEGIKVGSITIDPPRGRDCNNALNLSHRTRYDHSTHHVTLYPDSCLGCDFFERRGEKRIDIRRFFGYVCPIAKVWVRTNFGWVSFFT